MSRPVRRASSVSRAARSQSHSPRKDCPRSGTVLPWPLPRLQRHRGLQRGAAGGMRLRVLRPCGESARRAHSPRPARPLAALDRELEPSEVVAFEICRQARRRKGQELSCGQAAGCADEKVRATHQRLAGPYADPRQAYAPPSSWMIALHCASRRRGLAAPCSRGSLSLRGPGVSRPREAQRNHRRRSTSSTLRAISVVPARVSALGMTAGNQLSRRPRMSSLLDGSAKNP
jgi:hypothetical protein